MAKVVKRLRHGEIRFESVVVGGIRSKYGTIAGSSPALTAMSKRYSESLVQDLNNEPAECLRREWDIMGTKEGDTTPPSSVGCF